ncbi:hypothetical protein NQ315_017228 [Exocentrus adspersus]|uniref:Helitron helicase-like domain-containing protein n=1 Tax=Exocentrus adspersus TaxID=1586481 RepID=A0AAV8V6U3_9CUCU|nr:hypothetical protein NQ315_017228 [Exocentrus adspersus]
MNDRLRAAEYVGLADYLQLRIQLAKQRQNNDDNEDDTDEEDEEAATLGKMVILPSTFVGSPRHQQQLYQDAMAVVARFGIPSIFLTMITNTHWPEIVDNIPRGHSAADHPSLIDRVFNCKVQELLDDMLQSQIFGEPVANLNYPYNPYLLLKYKAHINVESCGTIQSVKYLYKYLFKSSDRALLQINVRNIIEYNEIENFLNGRYMSPLGACWHINEFPMHRNTHTVYRLFVHLPNRQIVRFRPGFEHQAIERNEVTKLTAWFILNQNDPNVHQHLYIDIPYFYVWNARERRWTVRQRGGDKIVVRMYSVHIRNQELYYLRLLLLHVRGARSYEEVRTVNGVIYETFKEAC